MKVITYSSMKDFIDDTLELLLKDEAVNQLLIFTALSKKDLATNYTLHAGKVIDENNEVSLIFLNSQPYNLLAYTPNETINVDAVKLLAEYLVNNNSEKQIMSKIVDYNEICNRLFVDYEDIIDL